MQRLQQGPGREAKQATAATAEGPPPSRWTLATIRATFASIHEYTLSGVWRWLRQDILKLHRLAGDAKGLRQRVNDFLDQFAQGSRALLRYVGLLGEGQLAKAIPKR